MNTKLIKNDQACRNQALNTNQSFIIQAPAGSGKTEILIQRFLALLCIVKKPEEILAITFTKKAANEMRFRILNALKEAAIHQEPHHEHAKKTYHLAKEVLQKDRHLKWHLLDNPNQLHIQTIDSLCAYLTKQLPLLSQFGSLPSINENPTILYQKAVHEVLNSIEDQNEYSQPIPEILLHLDNDLNKLNDLLIELLKRRDQWLPYIHLDMHDHEIRRYLEKQFENVILDNLEILSVAFPKHLIHELIAILQFASHHIPNNQQSPLISCKEMNVFPSIDIKDLDQWHSIKSLLLTKNFSYRKRVDAEIGFPSLAHIKNQHDKTIHLEYRKRFAMLIEKLNENDDLRLALKELALSPLPYYTDDQWKVLVSLFHILKAATIQLRLVFQQYGQIDFIENAQAALFALGQDENPTNLTLALDYQIKHILVDEFQDTSFTQYQLLEKLTLGWEQDDGRTLFVVGDPMQSIYRFREAEVGLFVRMRQYGINHINLIPLKLSLNFRSLPSIIDWNNRHFKQIFPTVDNMSIGAISYTESTSTATTQEQSVNVFGFLGDGDLQMNHLVTMINEIKIKSPHDTMAILVRSRSHLISIIPALKKAKIDYHAVDIESLSERQIIQDLLSLTKALMHPADRIAWLSLLRAPWCGLTLADLHIIAGKDAYATIWEMLLNNDVLEKLSPDGGARLKRILPILHIKMNERGRYPLRYWIESTWLLLGGPAILAHQYDVDDANTFFKLLENTNESNQDFSIDTIKNKVDHLYASTINTQAKLQIMTIHTAKGLEFDTVIIPQLQHKMPHDDKPLLLWMEQPLKNNKNALLITPIHATGNEKDSTYEYIYRQRKIKTACESDRLLYVATTRAKKNLHLLFNVNTNEEGEYKIEPSSFLEKLWPFIKHEDIISNVLDKQSQNKHPSHQDKIFVRLSHEWQNPIRCEVQTLAVHRKQDGFQIKDTIRAKIGTMTHKILQLISIYGIHWWRDALDHQSYLTQQYAQLQLPKENLDGAIQMTCQAITNTLNDKRGLWILHQHDDAKSEFSITASIHHEIVNLVIDRTFVDQDGARWIIDYKTATLTHQDLQLFLDKEQEKYLKKMHCYYEAFSMLEQRPIRLGLYFPALPAWKELELPSP